jgi:hypothetical protein
VTTRRQARLLLTLSLVLAAHIVVVWLLISSPLLLVKTRPGSLQLVWIPRPVLPSTAPERGTSTERARNPAPQHSNDRIRASPSVAPTSNEESNAIHPAPDWTEELHQAAKNALANELAQKRHDFDFAHAYPTPVKRPPQFAWNYAATHPIEALPEGRILIHLGDNCVLLLLPLPLVGCGIGKRPVNGDLFQHMGDR